MDGEIDGWRERRIDSGITEIKIQVEILTIRMWEAAPPQKKILRNKQQWKSELPAVVYDEESRPCVLLIQKVSDSPYQLQWRVALQIFAQNSLLLAES